jgi:hypothetical protein
LRSRTFIFIFIGRNDISNCVGTSFHTFCVAIQRDYRYFINSIFPFDSRYCLIGFFDEFKQKTKEKLDKQQEIMIEWVVKLAPEANADAVAAEYGFENKGSVRDLPNSYVFSLLPQYQQPPENIVLVSQLQKSPVVQAFVSYHPDKIKEFVKLEYDRMEKEEPGSAVKLLKSLHSTENKNDPEVKQSAEAPYRKLLQVLLNNQCYFY